MTRAPLERAVDRRRVAGIGTLPEPAFHLGPVGFCGRPVTPALRTPVVAKPLEIIMIGGIEATEELLENLEIFADREEREKEAEVKRDKESSGANDL